MVLLSVCCPNSSEAFTRKSILEWKRPSPSFLLAGNCAEQDAPSHDGWVSGWSCFTQWRVLVFIAVEEGWAVPFSFLQNTRVSVDLSLVDTGQFLSPIRWPSDAPLALGMVYFGWSWLGFMSEGVCNVSSSAGTRGRKRTAMW